jgi:succinate-semialdehyde dehydrogenase / glutarate-semialdehyde dehydrogenase
MPDKVALLPKGFIVVNEVYSEFLEHFTNEMNQAYFGDPCHSDTTMGPLARKDLRDELHQQVLNSVKNGAEIVLGGEIPNRKGAFYPPTILENVKPGMPAYDEELFGPVASVIRVKDEAEAIKVANDTDLVWVQQFLPATLKMENTSLKNCWMQAAVL